MSTSQKSNGSRVGVKEIARRANVALATVDRVINKRPGVSKKTYEKVQKIIDELNYKPNIIASRLASMQENRFAVLIPEISEESGFFWKDPADGVSVAAEELSSMGIFVEVFYFDQNSKSSFVKESKKILNGHFDAVLLAPFFTQEAIEFTNVCAKLAIPFIFINSDIPDQKSLCYIGPNLYATGYLGGQLISFILQDQDQVLIINISNDIKGSRQNRLLRKEEGARAYFQEKNKKNKIRKIDITQTDEISVSEKLRKTLNDYPDIAVIFVTNSRVVSVAKFIQENHINHIRLIGYDLIDESVAYLKNGVIDFLICQKPREQAYRGIMALYHHLVLKLPIEQIQHMPIDIVTCENYSYYKN